jgi:DNA polymerase-4
MDLEEIQQEVAEMARGTAAWLDKRQLFARTVTIKVRYSDFTTITRSHTETATREESSLVRRAVALLDKTEAGQRPVRLLGVSVHNLCDVVTPTRIPDPSSELRLPFDRHEGHEDVESHEDHEGHEGTKQEP